MNTAAPPSRSLSTFFLLLFALSLPFWLAGAITGLQLLPGLPVSAVMFLCPATAASILVFKENRTAGLIELLKRSFDYARIRSKVWMVPSLLVMPGATIVMYALMRVMGWSLPPPQFPILAALAIFAVGFVAALGEELGWSGYVIDPLQDRWGALAAAVLVGLVWAIWHWVPLIQAHRSPAWIAWWTLGTVARRVLIVWLYNNTGRSVFGAAVFHAMSNVSWQLFPISGSHWDPRTDGLITGFAAAIVTGIWGPRTLTRHRNW